MSQPPTIFETRGEAGTTGGADQRPRPARFQHSLSARLLLLTIFFVMVAEILIYTPSIARYRLNWLEDKLGEGHLAALAVVAASEGMVTEELEDELLDDLAAYVVDVRTSSYAGEQRTYLLGRVMPPEPDHIVFLDQGGVFDLILDAFDTLMNGAERVIRVDGTSPRDPATRVMMIIDEGPLCEEMLAFSLRILALSIIISLITASLVYMALHWMMVRPVLRITGRMMAFRENPADSQPLATTRRRDEVGVAERELVFMQDTIRATLGQRERLATLGTAMTKINHDLRNILTSASLLSERLAASEDPQVRRVVPMVLDAIDRAAALCSRTLDYSREGAAPLSRSPVNLRALVELGVRDVAPVMAEGAVWDNAVPDGLEVSADAKELRRVFSNLGRNAFEAGARRVTIGARAAGDGRIEIEMRDDGPGLPERASRHLFQPFAGSVRSGGTGLGLAIAREVVVRHGGSIALLETGPTGTAFRVDLPA